MSHFHPTVNKCFGFVGFEVSNSTKPNHFNITPGTTNYNMITSLSQLCQNSTPPEIRFSMLGKSSKHILYKSWFNRDLPRKKIKHHLIKKKLNLDTWNNPSPLRLKYQQLILLLFACLVIGKTYSTKWWWKMGDDHHGIESAKHQQNKSKE